MPGTPLIVAELFGKLIIAMLQSIVLRRVYQPKTKRKPTFLFIDEAQVKSDLSKIR